MGRIYRATSCVNYRPSLLSEYPVIRLKLFNVLGEEYPEELEVPVDTGFEGSLMLESSDYEFFAVGELPRDYWRVYRTLAGSVTMRVARAVARIGDLELEIYVETPLYGPGKKLLGREVLNKLKIVLDGLRRECCLASDHVQTRPR